MVSRSTLKASAAAAVITMVAAQGANADTLRLLTWGGYAPEAVIELFEKETGHTVEVTKSNNEEMIAKLRATGGGGFDLAQPSQDRIAGPQTAASLTGLVYQYFRSEMFRLFGEKSIALPMKQNKGKCWSRAL